MRILVIIDAEGCSSYDVTLNNAESAMIEEISALLEALNIQGTDTTVIDAHGNGHNIDKLKDYFSNIEFVNHLWDLHRYDFDISMLIGFHSKAGSNSVRAHTIRPEIQEIRFGGIAVGEVTLLVNWLSYFGIPIVFVSGEKELLPEIRNLEIPFFLYEEHPIRSNLYSMCELAVQSLNGVGKLHEYQNDPINIKFKELIYLDFIPMWMGRIEKDTVEISNTMLFIELLPVLSELINCANSMKITCMNRLRYLHFNDPKLLEQIQVKHKELFEKDKKYISGGSYQKILYGSYITRETIKWVE